MFILAILGPFLLISWFIVFWRAEVAEHVTCELVRYYMFNFALYIFALVFGEVLHLSFHLGHLYRQLLFFLIPKYLHHSADHCIW